MLLIPSMKKTVNARPRLIPRIIGCPQYGLADGRRICGGVLQKHRDALVIEHGWSSSTLGDSLGDEKQLGMPVECQNYRFIGAVSKKSQWNAARLENTRLFRIVKQSEEVAGMVIGKDIESQVVAT
jgi:hypothetical protein